MAPTASSNQSLLPENVSTGGDYWKIFAGALVGGILIMLSFILILLWKLYKLSNTSKTTRIPSEVDVEQNPLVNRSNPDDESQFEAERVIERTSHYTISAGKMKKPNPSTERDKLDVLVRRPTDPLDSTQKDMIKNESIFLSELKKTIGEESSSSFFINHPNILIYLGESSDKLSTITEYPEGGNLQHFVRRFHSKNFDNKLSNEEYNKDNIDLDNNLNTLSTFDLLSFAYQIANGMRFLAGERCSHRLLTLQNMFVTANKTIKIGNFSLARKFGNNDYYKISTPNQPIPTTHRAPETNDTSDEKRFTEQSDVWSYSVSLYELFSLGNVAYEGARDVKEFLAEEEVLEKPEYCHREIYEFMIEGWNRDQFKRPVFSKWTEFLEGHMEKHGLQLKDQIERKLRVTSDNQARLEAWAV